MFGWINLFDSKIFHSLMIFHLILIRYETVDINIAIATDAGVLVTPIVYNVDQKVDYNCYLNKIRLCLFFLFRVFPL